MYLIETMSQYAGDLADHMLELLRSEDLRITAPRRAVVWALADGPSHSTAAEILERARQHHAPLGRATVYRTLELLSRQGALRAWAGEHGQTEYVRVLGGHHHLMCASCGKLTELPPCNDMCPAAALAGGARTRGHLVEVVDICRTCAVEEDAR